MESTLTARSRTRTLGAGWSIEPGSVCAWLLPAALVTYLGVRSGGYDPIVSDQVGIALWWLVFLILALALVPHPPDRVGASRPRRCSSPTRPGRPSASAWTESSERTMGDVTLMLLYVALALLAFTDPWARARRA